MKYLRLFEEYIGEKGDKKKSKRTAISNFPHIAKDESKKRKRKKSSSHRGGWQDGMGRPSKKSSDSSSDSGWQDGMGRP